MDLGNGFMDNEVMEQQVCDAVEEHEEVPSAIPAGPGGDGATAKAVEDDEDDRKLFVGALNWQTTKGNLEKYFADFGEVTKVDLKEDLNGRSRCFGFVTFKDAGSREKVLTQERHELDGRNIDPKKVQPRVFKIFVGALDPNVKSDEIKAHFSQFGEVVEMDLPMHKSSGERRAFGFIRFKTEESMNKALQSPKAVLGAREYEIKKATQNQRGAFGFHGSRGRGYRGQGRGWGYHPGYFHQNYSGFPYGSYNYGSYPGSYEHYSNWEGNYQHSNNYGGASPHWL